MRICCRAPRLHSVACDNDLGHCKAVGSFLSTLRLAKSLACGVDKEGVLVCSGMRRLRWCEVIEVLNARGFGRWFVERGQ